jgi:hypothetical protein
VRWLDVVFGLGLLVFLGWCVQAMPWLAVALVVLLLVAALTTLPAVRA